MKYLIIQRQQRANELLHYVADFQWNNENEITICNFSEPGTSDILLKSSGCLVFLVEEYNAANSSQNRSLKVFQQHINQNNNTKKRATLIFGADGVYASYIPYPHKIFHYENWKKRR